MDAPNIPHVNIYKNRFSVLTSAQTTLEQTTSATGHPIHWITLITALLLHPVDGEAAVERLRLFLRQSLTTRRGSPRLRGGLKEHPGHLK